MEQDPGRQFRRHARVSSPLTHLMQLLVSGAIGRGVFPAFVQIKIRMSRHDAPRMLVDLSMNRFQKVKIFVTILLIHDTAETYVGDQNRRERDPSSKPASLKWLAVRASSRPRFRVANLPVKVS